MRQQIIITFVFISLVFGLVSSKPNKSELFKAKVIPRDESLETPATLLTTNDTTEGGKKSRMKRGGKAAARLKIRRKLAQKRGETFGNNYRL